MLGARRLIQGRPNLFRIGIVHRVQMEPRDGERESYLLFSCFVWPVAGKIEKFRLIHAARIEIGMGR